MTKEIAGIVLAAGLSSRMGQSKPLMPWINHKTVIEHILAQVAQVHLAQITVVTGYCAEQVAARAAAMGSPVIYNPDYAHGEMLSSLKVGLLAQPNTVSAALVILGDQPRIEIPIVQQILDAYALDQGEIVAPVYRGERGHPILITRRFWDEIIALPSGGAPRDVIRQHRDVTHLIDVETDSVLSDIDTPEDYARERQRAELTE
jgi:molybdenum cofactor cytidylyltransferase